MAIFIVTGHPGSGKRTLIEGAKAEKLGDKSLLFADESTDQASVEQHLLAAGRVCLCEPGNSSNDWAAWAASWQFRTVIVRVVRGEGQSAPTAGASDGPSSLHDCVTLLNNADVAAGVRRLVAVFDDAMKYTLWLVPPRSSKCFREASDLGAELSRRFDVPPILPHVTLSPSFYGSQDLAVELTRRVAAELVPLNLSFVGFEHSSNQFKAMAATVQMSEPLRKSNEVAKTIVKETKAFAPHLSLLYATLEEKPREEVAHSLEQRVDLSTWSCEVEEVVCYTTMGTSYHCWNEVCRIPMGSNPPLDD